jgi:hypothetical protein
MSGDGNIRLNINFLKTGQYIDLMLIGSAKILLKSMA